MINNYLPTDYQNFIALSRYARWKEDEQRRENWGETVDRYFDYMTNHLENNHIDSIGSLLHENWLLKKQITKGVSDKKIDEWYMRGINAGALGGKLMGAGHGGFLMFMADPKNHRNIIKSLSDLKHVPFSFDQSGSCIVYNDQNK